MSKLSQQLRWHGTWWGASVWVEKNNYETLSEAWANYPEGDWMLHLSSTLAVDFRLLTLAKARCARTVRHLMTDRRSLRALDTAHYFGLGSGSEDDLSAHLLDALEACWEVSGPTQKAAATAALASVDLCSLYTAGDHVASYAANDAAAEAVYDLSDPSNLNHEAAHAAERANQLKTANICREVLTDAVLARWKEVTNE